MYIYFRLVALNFWSMYVKYVSLISACGNIELSRIFDEKFYS